MAYKTPNFVHVSRADLVKRISQKMGLQKGKIYKAIDFILRSATNDLLDNMVVPIGKFGTLAPCLYRYKDKFNKNHEYTVIRFYTDKSFQKLLNERKQEYRYEESLEDTIGYQAESDKKAEEEANEEDPKEE
jgi:hypothetical protein